MGDKAAASGKAPRPPAKLAPPAPAPTDRQKAMEVNKRLTDAEARAAEAEKEKSLLEERMKEREQLLRKKQEIGKGKNTSEKQRKTNGQPQINGICFYLHALVLLAHEEEVTLFHVGSGAGSESQ